MFIGNLYIGTSGWSYKHWSGIFYPSDLKSEKYLEYYMARFSCVELNSSFYHLPLRSTVTGWMTRTPDPFRFCPKMSRYITHRMHLVNIEEPLYKFFDVFEGLKTKLGPVLIQLHPGLKYDRSLICNFFDLLKEKYCMYQVAVEVRNKTWINDNFLDLLDKYGFGFVIADSGGRYPYIEAVTAGFAYLRFHGPEQLYASDYPDATLHYYADKIKIWLGENKNVWAFFNNDYYGFAVKNASKLRELVGVHS